MGTPEFSLPTLKKIYQSNHKVQLVVTQPDRPKGRGRESTPPPVKQFALENNIPILQPEKCTSPKTVKTLAALNSDVFIIVAYGQILDNNLLSLPKYFCINLHSSLLPNYRGSAPINWVIINGEKETGVTTFFINNKIDEGDIIEKKKIKIEENETAGSLHDKLMEKGANLLLKSVKDIFNGNVNTSKQKISKNDKKAPKIDKKLCEINLNSNSKKIVQLIRGLSPYPGAKIIHKDKLIKIIDARITRKSKKEIIGLIEENNKIFLNNNLGESIEILELQIEGKNRMNFKDYLRGNTI